MISISILAVSFLTAIAFLIVSSSNATLQQVRFNKIVGVVHNTYCRLYTFTQYGNQISVKKACTIKCMNDPDCLFFCIGKGERECDMFDVPVAVRFPGHESGVSYGACYTSWGDPRDVIKLDTPITFSSVQKPESSDTYVVTDGVSCAKGFHCLTQAVADSYIQVDLEVAIRVKAVTVIVPYSDYYTNITIYLGNTTSFTSHPAYGERPGTAPAWASTTMKGDNSFAGRYLTIVSRSSNHLGICEVQVIKN